MRGKKVAEILAFLERRRHSALLASVVAVFLARPMIGQGALAAIVVSLTLLLVLMAALLTIRIDDLVGERRVLQRQIARRRTVGWVLAALALGERLWVLLFPSPSAVLWGTASWVAFFCYVTGSQLRSLLRQRKVTSETIAMSVSVYLLIGLCWALLFEIMLLRHPESFTFAHAGDGEGLASAPVMVYFSLTVLSTVGFGDITPVTLPARYAAVAEGIVGQLYLTILVARLVGMRIGTAEDPP